MTSDRVPLEPCLAFLRSLDGVSPDQAIERLRGLRAELGIAIELMWEREPALERYEYELVLGAPDASTISLAWAPQAGAMPFAMRGMQRMQEGQLVKVDGRSLWMHEAVVLLDPFWAEAPIRRRIVDYCILRREREARPYRAGVEELQRAVDEFRRTRGLDSAEKTAAWLDSQGLSLADLEDRLEAELARDAIRRDKVGARAEAEFARAPDSWDEIRLAAFPAADADELAGAIREGAAFFEVARRCEGRRTILVETFRRRDIAAEPPLETGSVLAARLAGAGPYVVAVEKVMPARWDDRTRGAVEEALFRGWLDDAASRAHIEWNWGPA
jgi:putative peptide maturation system protein